MHRNGLLLLSWFAVTLISMLGCDHPQPLDPVVPADVKIKRLVFDVDDFSQNPRELKQNVPRLFAEGCAPSEKDLQRFADYSYEWKEPVQKGDTATIVVTIKDAKTKNPLGDFTWSMKKVEDRWRITDAPLPAK